MSLFLYGTYLKGSQVEKSTVFRRARSQGGLTPLDSLDFYTLDERSLAAIVDCAY